MSFLTSQMKTFIFFSLSFVGGLALFFSVSEDMVIQRDPAAINGKVMQISNLSPIQIKQQLNNKIKVQFVIDGQKAVRLEGFSSALCKSYSHIELSFEAEGTAVAGRAPSMVIKTPCEPGQDPAEMASVVIPYGKILLEKPRNAEFRFDGFTSRFEFNNSADEWPRTWVLKTVEFKSDRKSGTESEYVASKLVDLSNTADSQPNPLVVLEF